MTEERNAGIEAMENLEMEILEREKKNRAENPACKPAGLQDDERKRSRRVTGGAGGDSTLVIGSEKTALIDTGMAYCAEKMIEGLEKALAGRPLDYVLASHTHYDHIGGLPYLRKRWPELIAVGNAHAQYVLARPGALRFIRQMSEYAAFDYFQEKDCPPIEYDDVDLRIDRVASEGDVISLGDRRIKVLETPGHTNCSISFFIEEEKLLFHSESVGCYLGNGEFTCAILTSYSQAMESIEKCRTYHPDKVISPHYGEVRGMGYNEYFDLAVRQAEDMKAFILRCHANGDNEEAILKVCTERYWKKSAFREQPSKAFLVNTEAMIRVVLKENGLTSK